MPVTLDHLRGRLSAQHAAAERRAAAAHLAATDIVNRARHAGRANLTATEEQNITRYIAERDRARDELAQLGPRVSEVDRLSTELAADRAAWDNVQPTRTALPAYDRVARVGREQRTYRPDEDPKGLGFLRDVARGQLLGNPLAAERLARHCREEEIERPQVAAQQERASTTTNFSGLVVPQYLTEFFAPAVAAMRPFADVCTGHDLSPEGMTVNFGQLSIPSVVQLQANQGDTVGNADLDDTLVTENVQTAAGYVQVSRQSVDRGVFTDDRIMEELLKRCATCLDSTLINQASTGLVALTTAGTTAYTTTGATAAGLWPKLFAAQNVVETALLNQASPSHFIFAPRRWNWLCSQVGSTWPVIGSAAVPPQMAGMILTNEYGPAVRAVLNNGMRVVVDANVPTNQGASTNQDAVFCIASGECHLWEDPNAPVYIRAEQPAATTLGIVFVIWEYFAYSFRRYTAAASVTGTGLITPAFT